MKRTHSAIRTSALIAAMLTATVGSVAQASVIKANSPNNIAFYTQVTAGYYDEALTYHQSQAERFGTSDPDLGTVFEVSAAASHLPATGAAKDISEGNATVHFSWGAPIGPAVRDEIRFNVTGTISAMEARDESGNPLTGFVEASARAMFYFDAGYAGVAPDTVVGSLMLPSLREAEPFEHTLILEFRATPTSAPHLVEVITLAAGDTGFSVDLRANYMYELILTYGAEVPFGVDPPFDLSVVATLIPEPHTLGIIACGAFVLLRRRQTMR